MSAKTHPPCDKCRALLQSPATADGCTKGSIWGTHNFCCYKDRRVRRLDTIALNLCHILCLRCAFETHQDWDFSGIQASIASNYLSGKGGKGDPNAKRYVQCVRYLRDNKFPWVDGWPDTLTPCPLLDENFCTVIRCLYCKPRKRRMDIVVALVSVLARDVVRVVMSFEPVGFHERSCSHSCTCPRCCPGATMQKKGI